MRLSAPNDSLNAYTISLKILSLNNLETTPGETGFAMRRQGTTVETGTLYPIHSPCTFSGTRNGWRESLLSSGTDTPGPTLWFSTMCRRQKIPHPDMPEVFCCAPYDAKSRQYSFCDGVTEIISAPQDGWHNACTIERELRMKIHGQTLRRSSAYQRCGLALQAHDSQGVAFYFYQNDRTPCFSSIKMNKGISSSMQRCR